MSHIDKEKQKLVARIKRIRGQVDSIERSLTTEMCVIADAAHPVALAGVMGGAETEIRGATRNTWITARIAKRHLGGVLIVLADEENRQIPDRGHVEAFVERPIVDRPIAEEGDGNARGWNSRAGHAQNRPFTQQDVG